VGHQEKSDEYWIIGLFDFSHKLSVCRKCANGEKIRTN
jgi:hypothetical protein